MDSGTMQNSVAVRQIEFDRYPSLPPFDPADKYSEYDFACVSEANDVYDAIRNVLFDLMLDADNFGKREWNPFKDFIKPGYTVVIKPNLVLDVDNQDAVTTHASVIRPLVDYAWKAMHGDGKIVICDAPVIFADFDGMVKKNGLLEMVETLKRRGINITLADLRARRVKTENNVCVSEFDDPENAKNAVIVDLKDMSFFDEETVKQNKLAYGAYGRNQVKKNHNKGKHHYCISRLILAADAVISVPKLKTHKKAGLTCCLKNLVGINVDKNYLPHYTAGPANWNGDEFPRLPKWRIPLLLAFKAARRVLLGSLGKITAKFISRCAGGLNKIRFKIDEDSPSGKADTAQKVYRLVTGTDYGGSWGGNETIWRMILDLNRIFLFADATGNMTAEKKRNVFNLVDGFTAGVKNGPLNPHMIKPGIVAAGFNGALVDKALLHLAGIDADKIPLYREAFSKKAEWLHDNLDVHVRLNGKNLAFGDIQPIVRLHEPAGWEFSGSRKK